MAPDAAGFRVMALHAHPDDEASKGAGTVARYRTEGASSTLVCCTGGEAGDILNSEMDTPEARADLTAVRRRELDDSVRIIGYDRLHLLGYRDSGMPGTEANADPTNFANAPLDEAVGRVVALVRAERPHVLIGYGPDRVYAHPDHVRVHDVGEVVFDRAGDPNWYPQAGPPWQPSKLYWCAGFTRRRIESMHEWFVGRGEESPFAEWLAQLDDDHDAAITTRIDVREWAAVARDALLAHRTQIPPDSFFLTVPLQEMAELHPWDEYILARSLVGPPPGDDYEDDLFAGLRTATAAGRD
jgi:mycothiol S-conjugate amidase